MSSYEAMTDLVPRQLRIATTAWMLTVSLAAAAPPGELNTGAEQPPPCGPWRWVNPLP